MLAYIVLLMIIQYIPDRPLIMDILVWFGLIISFLSMGIKIGKGEKHGK